MHASMALRTVPQSDTPHITFACDTPWVPMSAGQAFKPIRFMRDGAGYLALLRLEPGARIPPHRHTGEVHAFNLEGSRQLHSGETIGPGDYVFEPAGNLDSWQAIGDQPLVVLVVVRGDVEYLDERGEVAARYNAQSMEAAYRRYCEEHAMQARELTD